MKKWALFPIAKPQTLGRKDRNEKGVGRAKAAHPQCPWMMDVAIELPVTPYAAQR
jgi:hypothetical protein